jgi:quercetin dioxygenase-like cupin family protein
VKVWANQLKASLAEIAGYEAVMEGQDMRAVVLTLAAGQCVPWHYHSDITDSFICLEGSMLVETRAPRAMHALLPGERREVPPTMLPLVFPKPLTRSNPLMSG